MAPNHGGEPLASVLGPMGSHCGQKMGQNRKKLPCPKIRIFDYSAVIDLGKKSNWRLWRQITIGTLYGPSWGQWGPIGSKKWVKTVKKLPCPKIRIFDYSAVIDFGKKSNLLLWRQITVENPKGTSWGQWGPIGGNKCVKTVKKLPCPKIRIFDYSAVINLCKKSKLRFWRQITVGTP